MDERRRHPRMRVLKSGKIIVAEKSPAIPCIVRNVSVYGACLQVDSQHGIPDVFMIVIDGIQHRCRVAWRASPKMGVSYQADDYQHAA